MPEVSRSEARRRLNNAVRIFEWSSLMADPNEFLEVYRSFHAQLREGDTLDIRLDTTTSHARYGLEHTGVVFEIVLRENNGEGRPVYWMDTDGSTSIGPILYTDP